jgi:mono/diheme cytochrome c family protein
MSKDKVAPLGLWGLFLVVTVAAGAWLALAAPTHTQRERPRSADAIDTSAEINDGELLRLAEDQEAVHAGARLFSRYCSRCHGSVGEGSVGPNLTDDFWIGGSTPIDIYWTIHDGRMARGMPAAGALGAAACKKVAAYVLAVRGRNLPGRSPQGKPTAGTQPVPATRVAGR